MDLLKARILKDGKVYDGDILKVDNFLNHQVDTAFLMEIGKEFYQRFKNCGVTKILTIEASGIAVSFATAQFFDNCPVVFAKKGDAANMSSNAYHAPVHSYTHNQDYLISVSKEYLSKEDRVLILDDFLANGEALEGLLSVARQAECHLCGAGVVIEKAYQPGGDKIRQSGVRLESLARVKSMSVKKGIEFCQD